MKIIICIFAVAALTMANNTTDVQRMLKNSNDQFTAQMFNEVVKANPDKSVVLSAFSVLSPLAQLAVASVGESHIEILHALGFPYASVAVTVMNAANQQMRSVKGITLETANKIYVADGYTLNERFAVLSKDNFNSEVQNLNFGNNKEAVKTINTWVEDHTNARIKDLVTPDMIDAGTLAVLVNAIYFKGSWKNKFLTDFTENRPFHVNKDKTIEVPTMYRSGYYAYGESVELNAKLLEIPYEGEESSFLIVLPNNIGDIQALANKLKDFKVLERAQENMHTTEVDLYLPKFKIETTTDLVKVLRNMNVKKLFSPEARLDMLLKDATGLYITDAKQKAFIEINEEGAEAAAANVFALAALTFANDTDLQTMLKNSNDQFTAQMFNEVAKANPDKSFVLSAFSVLPPLAQLALASVGESHDELLKAIGFPNNNVTTAVMTDLNRELRTIKGVTLEMANKIYVADGYTLNDQFAVLSKDVFNSEVQNLNFGNTKEAAKIINTWVEDHTNQRIKDLVSPDSLDGSTVSVLVNAIYFKGIWKDKFDNYLTQNRPFHVTKDKTIQVPTMYRLGDYAYGESAELDGKLLEIPYEGEESSFLIVLPNNVGDIQALENKLKDIKLLEKAQQSMYETEVYVYLPKFKIETTSKLKDVLQKMNVKKMFSRGEARLDNLLKDTKNIFVSDAIQKAFIEVNEGGAEAAAADAFEIINTSAIMSIYEPKLFKADRPYCFFLKKGNIILFAGVYNP